MNRLFQIFHSLSLLAASAWAIDEPSYTVVKKEGKFEVRRYAPYIVAEVTVPAAALDEASTAGFRKLFKFITGANISRSDIAMTAPVTAQRSQEIPMTAPVTSVRGESGFTIGFVMPAEFTLATTPQPTDSAIILREVPVRTVAVVRFSGRWTDEHVAERTGSLQQWVNEQGYTPLSAPLIARYDPPIMPWFLRRNEIQIEIQPLR